MVGFDYCVNYLFAKIPKINNLKQNPGQFGRGACWVAGSTSVYLTTFFNR